MGVIHETAHRNVCLLCSCITGNGRGAGWSDPATRISRYRGGREPGQHDPAHGLRRCHRLYISTEQQEKDAPDDGIIALQLDAHHHADQHPAFQQHRQRHRIAVYKGALYAASAHTLYRITLSGKTLVPTAKPETVVV